MNKIYFGLFAVIQLARAADRTSPVLDKVTPAIPGAIQSIELCNVRIEGWLGARVDANEASRLLAVDTAPLLAGFKQRPGEHPWIGEHVGKWLHASTLAWAYSGNAALRKKMDEVVVELISTQEPDGYLGTYSPEKRFGLWKGADWDVWSHKYNLVGLLTYYRYTGNEPALAACRRIADLLIATFPAKKSILAAGTHRGMAATSVIGPVVELYRVTGEPRYLAFARYIVAAYDEPRGPAIIHTLLTSKQVNLTANAKAYELLSNLVGLTDLARVTGDKEILLAVNNAWEDVVTRRLYLTGSASTHERFGSDHELPNNQEADQGETCVTTTWIQLNKLLLELTAEAKYGDEIERSLYNHLAAAQNPRGDDWCYYTALDGVKKYDKGITCCHSSGPRGMALAPAVAYLHSEDTILVNTLETSEGRFELSGKHIEIHQQSRFPFEGTTTLRVRTEGAARFGIKIRVPSWAGPMRAGSLAKEDGWLEIPARDWHDGDSVPIDFTLKAKIIQGTHGNDGKVAYSWGPFILAFDQSLNPGPLGPEAIRMFDSAVPTPARGGESLLFETKIRGAGDVGPQPAKLVPFADAGANGGRYCVWMRAPL